MRATTLDTIYDPFRERDDPSPCRHNEPTAQFYDRCSNPVISAVRANLEAWYAAWPRDRSRPHLRARLRSTDRRQWNGAVWELYVHEALRRMALGPVPDPKVSHSSFTPDFVTTRGVPMYVECTTVAHSDAEATRRGGVGELEAAIDAIDVLDYWLDLQIDEYGPQPIPPRRFVTGLRRWLLDQDIDLLSALAGRGLGGMPWYEWRESGWLVREWAIPRSPEMRGRRELRPLGMLPVEDDGKDVWIALRQKMELKADRYGELGTALVIAVNAPDAWENNPQVPWSAFGPHPFTEAWERDGFFLRDDGRTYPNVSGVLVATALQPHSFTRQAPVLFENPEARYPVPDTVMWKRVRIEGGEPIEIAGVDPSDLFDLPAAWPGVAWP